MKPLACLLAICLLGSCAGSQWHLSSVRPKAAITPAESYAFIIFQLRDGEPVPTSK